MKITVADFDRDDLKELLTHHLSEAEQQDCSSAFTLDRLRLPEVTLFEARDDEGRLMGIAALKRLSDEHGEIKSVRTHPDFLRRGVSRALMQHLTDFAREQSFQRLSLETHPTPAYAAARGLYEALGYDYCGAFGEYTDHETSVFMTKAL